jgi:phenylpyruvate tautomerase PptA (4-oxalocrotonate tautomerase family)
MINIYVPEGTFPKESTGEVLRQLAECFLRWTDASEIQVARDNTGAFLHVLPPACVTAGGKPAMVVRVDVKVPEVVLSTIERRRGFIAEATEIVSALSVEAHTPDRTWVTISNAVDGGWGFGGHGLTNAELDDL